MFQLMEAIPNVSMLRLGRVVIRSCVLLPATQLVEEKIKPMVNFMQLIQNWNYSMDTVLENATYVDNQLGIILQKITLFLPSKFQVYDLKKAERIYHISNTNKIIRNNGKSYYQLIILTSDKSYRRKNHLFSLRMWAKTPPDDHNHSSMQC